MENPELDPTLIAWCAEVSDALTLDGVEVDIKKLLGLAGRAAHSVLRPAAPLTTYLVGYAAGLAAADGPRAAAVATDQAIESALLLCTERERTNEG